MDIAANIWSTSLVLIIASYVVFLASTTIDKEPLSTVSLYACAFSFAGFLLSSLYLIWS